MKIDAALNKFPGQFAALLLATAMGIPAMAQQAQPMASSAPQNTPPAAQSQPAAGSTITQSKEGFWGHVNPFARKKWVKKQTDPINDRLSELDEINSKNSHDIQDVDSRAQAGIGRAQTAAEAANATANAANSQAQQAGNTAQGAAGHVDQLNSTVNGLDQYHPVTEADISFRGGSPVLSAASRKKLDDLAASVTGQKGYILEVEGHSPLHGSAGIQSSERMAEAVKRYLVTSHEIPVYRMHAVALGNAHGQADQDDKPIRLSSVHIRVMANSLAAQESASPQSAPSSNDTDRP